ncbi:MAG: hypothetical protein ACYCYM_12095 [Saccharofermentanales bacterium]
MKKNLVLLAVLVFSLMSVIPQTVLADQLSDWTLSGTTATVVQDGISFKADTVDALTYAVYKVAQKTDSVTVEITPTFCEKKTDVDAWICVSFMGVPSMFSLDQQATTPGFVALYYNYKGTFRIALDGYMQDIYNGLDSWRLMEKGTPLKVGQKNKIELKWDTEQNFYHLIINDVQMDDNAQLMLGKKETIFPTGDKYILVGSYTQSGQPAEFVINSINGTAIGGTTSSQGGSSAAASTASSASSGTESQAASSVESITASSEESSDGASEDSIDSVDAQSIETSVISENDGMASNDDDGSDNKSGMWIIIVIAAGVLAAASAIFFIARSKAGKG